MVQRLVIAGADAYEQHWNGATPHDVEKNDRNCRTFFRQHTTIVSALAEDPTALASAAYVHCATLSSLKTEATPVTSLSLDPHHLEPPLLWAPRTARAPLIIWARNVFIVKIATATEPFTDLPDDCAGDVLEYLQMSMTRMEASRIATLSLSPEAHSWVRAVLVAEAVVSSE